MSIDNLHSNPPWSVYWILTARDRNVMQVIDTIKMRKHITIHGANPIPDDLPDVVPLVFESVEAAEGYQALIGASNMQIVPCPFPLTIFAIYRGGGRFEIRLPQPG